MSHAEIVVDTSALMAILQEEPEAKFCRRAIREAEAITMSAGTFAEALVVAELRGIRDGMLQLIDDLAIEVVPLDRDGARRAAAAYARWGKGLHPAALNFGDSFAYALAAERGCPLLYIGNDFARTDVARAD